MPGDLVELEPHNALLFSVMIAGGDVAFWHGKLGKVDPQAEDADKRYGAIYNQVRAGNREMRMAAKAAIDAGISERETLMAERMGGLLATFAENIVGDLELTPRQEQMFEDAVKRQLYELEAEGGTYAARKATRRRKAKMSKAAAKIRPVDDSDDVEPGLRVA